MRLTKELVERIEEITKTDYNFNENYETNSWDVLVEDLIIFYDSLEKEYNDYKENKEEK